MLFQIRHMLCAAFGALMMAGPVAAQDTPEFGLELNNAANTADGNCRLTYVASNATGSVLSQIAYEVAVFDGAGTVTRILVLEFGALPEGKTKVLQFDLAGQSCEDTSRIIVNDATQCALGDGGQGDFCVTGLNASSRVENIQFSL